MSSKRLDPSSVLSQHPTLALAMTVAALGASLGACKKSDVSEGLPPAASGAENTLLPGAAQQLKVTPGEVRQDKHLPGSIEQVKLQPGATEQVKLQPGSTEQVKLQPGSTEQVKLAPGAAK